MRIVVCPDKFAGTLSASEAASAIALGWQEFAPETEVTLIPISDGGFGFLDSISCALNLTTEPVLVRGLLGQSIPVEYAFDHQTAYIEVAQSIGIHLLEPSSQTALVASSYGVGQLIKAAIDKGLTKIVIGLGGTATSDGGAGALAALGAVAFNSEDIQIDALENGVVELKGISRIDLSQVEELLENISIEVLTDVDNPFLGARGAAKVFSSQKGATEKQIQEIEERLTHFAQLIGKRKDGRNPAVALGAGAAGGLGFALIRIGAVRSAGIERIISILGLKQAIEQADLVITGEGKFDWQSLDGKAVTGISRAAMSLGKATIVLAGQVEIGRRDRQTIGVSGAFSMSDFSTLTESLNDPASTLKRLSARVARTWNR
jgi:glycerate kinase